tara:strand:+ start:453 stop:779 length:327 start_codon:yes stop_codon:yes gene_type:complete
MRKLLTNFLATFFITTALNAENWIDMDIYYKGTQEIIKDQIASTKNIEKHLKDNIQIMRNRSRERNERFKIERLKRKESGELGSLKKPVPLPSDLRDKDLWGVINLNN